MSSWEQLQRHSQVFEEILFLDRTLDTLLTNVIPFRWPDEDLAGPYSTFVGESERVIFSYLHSFNQLEDGAIRFCSLLVEDNELRAYYCERPPFPEDLGSDRLRRSVLAHNIESVSFLYADLDEDRIDIVDEWEDQDYMPLGIQLTVTWTDGARHTWFRRTAGTSYFERWGKWEQKRMAPFL